MSYDQKKFDAINKILDGSEYAGKLAFLDHKAEIYKWGDDKIAVFDDFDDAYSFILDKFDTYFRENPQQIIYLYRKYVDENGWRKYVDENKLYEWLSENYDRMTKGAFGKYKEVMLSEIKSAPLDNLIIFTKGDQGKLSETLYTFMDIDALASELAEAMESRVYEHDGVFMVPLVQLPQSPHQ